MMEMIYAANPLAGKEIISSTMPLGLQAFLNASLAVAILAVATACLGIALRVMFRGRNATFEVCAIASVLAGVLCGRYGDAYGLNFVAVTIGIMAANFAIDYFARKLEQAAELRVAMAPELANYLLGRFDALDTGGKGYIARTDLMIAMSKGSFYHDDIILLSLALQDMHLIGHPVDASHVHAPSMIGGGAVIVHYGISREDLISYEERARKKFVKDFVDA